MSDASGGQQPPTGSSTAPANGVTAATLASTDASSLPPLPGAPGASTTIDEPAPAPPSTTSLKVKLGSLPTNGLPQLPTDDINQRPVPANVTVLKGPVVKIFQKQAFGGDKSKDLYMVTHEDDPTFPVFRSAAQLEQLAPNLLREFDQKYPAPPGQTVYIVGEDASTRNANARRTSSRVASVSNDTPAEDEQDDNDDGDDGQDESGDEFVAHAPYKEDDGAETEEDEDDSGSDFDDSEMGGTPKVKKRKGNKKRKEAPRPIEKRLAIHQREMYAQHDRGDDWDSEFAEVMSVPDSQASRRSGRARKRINYEEEMGLGAGTDTGSYPASDTGSVAGSSRRAKTQPAQRGRLEEIFPEDLDKIEPDPELGWAVQYQHRRYCARCEQPPVPEALQKLKARKMKKINSRSKKKVKSAEEEFAEDSDQEIDRVSKLGAWMKCNVCVEAYHFQCMPGALRKDFTDTLKAEHEAAWLEENPPPPPPVYDEPEYILDEETGQMVPPPPPSVVIPPRQDKPELDMRNMFAIPKCWSCKKAGGRRCFVCERLDETKEDDEAEVTEDKKDTTSAASALAADSPLPPLPTEDSVAPAADLPTTAVEPAAAPVGTQAAPGNEESAVPGLDAPAPAPLPPAAIAAVATNAAEESMPQSGATTAATATPAPMAEDEKDAEGEQDEDEDEFPPSLMFRCLKCHRASHYSCLEPTGDEYFEEQAGAYFKDGQCHDCFRWAVVLDVILAWAEDDSLPPMAKDEIDEDDVVDELPVTRRKDPETGKIYEIPNYLVKWQGLSYRQLSWVPHAYLAAVYPAKLGNFLQRGSQIVFDAPPAGEEPEESDNDKTELIGQIPLPDPNAEDRIPQSWRTPDRILNVWYQSKKNGETNLVEHRNYRNLPIEPEESVKLIRDAYIKWGDLPYSNASREAPPAEDDPSWPAFFKAYKHFLRANSPEMRVPRLNPKELDQYIRQPRYFKAVEKQPEYVRGGDLMPFQLEGVNFLYYKWSQRQGCILADEMGLGKTVQIITLLSVLYHEHQARPFLVTVPNSTIGNWVREFERWAPDMRVVPYSGDIESRRIIEEYELYDLQNNLKTDVVLATYESLEKNIETFRHVSRWDTLVVDEGQRLKSGTQGLLFNALQSLNIGHHILLSGTPLNNNIIELFNLLSFIDPGKWMNMDELTERYAELNPELVEEIRNILKPYFLRRTKDLVLNLPPLTEIVVPVSMSVLQRQIYKNILERNAAAIEQIYQRALPATGYKAKARKTNFNNILMELRKTLCHPYIIAPEMEPLDVTPQQAQANLTEASAKFVLLASMLPKLKAAGHRVLIFTQFKYMLTLLEKFLSGMKYKHLRLDGDTKQLDRQRGIDEFQAPGSEVFCYLLSTRAGGVGINLTSADTVIMFDQDFNPHQDIQAIARAHRIGQTKPVRVFKLLVKGTCEEKIFNAGNKKLGLDHLIIRRIDAKDETDDVESILQYGAKAIFDDKEAEATAIRYSDAEIDELLTRSAEPAKEGEQTAAGAFAHAKIWEKTGKLGDVSVEGGEDDGGNGDNMHGFWADIIDQQEAAARAARAAAAANIGRGRRTKPVSYQTDVPVSKTKKRRSAFDSDFDSSEDDFGAPARGMSDAESEDEFQFANDDKPRRRKGKGSDVLSDARLPPKRPRASKAQRARKRRDQLELLQKHAKRFNEPELESILIRTQTTNVRDQSYWLEEATKFIRGLAASTQTGVKAEGGETKPVTTDTEGSKGATPDVASTSAPGTTNGAGTPKSELLAGTTVDTEMKDVKDDIKSEVVATSATATDMAQSTASTETDKPKFVQSTLSFDTKPPVAAPAGADGATNAPVEATAASDASAPKAEANGSAPSEEKMDTSA
ncbi:hypothetical protein OIO90_002755 [Microbotryomycetes sp. JL221]|nr:hypothetical protein OIO90_002755 [Microbotryomycetes sp. JL221]